MVVLAVAAFTVAGVARAGRSARMTICAGNIRQLVLGETEYAAEYNGSGAPFCMDSRGLWTWSYKFWEPTLLQFIGGTSNVNQFNNGKVRPATLCTVQDIRVSRGAPGWKGAQQIRRFHDASAKPRLPERHDQWLPFVGNHRFRRCGTTHLRHRVKRLQQPARAAGNPTFHGSIAYRSTVYIQAWYRMAFVITGRFKSIARI